MSAPWWADEGEQRHTRQGLARGQFGRGTLDEPLAEAALLGPARPPAQPVFRVGRTISSGASCWCGGVNGHHDPEGLGLPHPEDPRQRVMREALEAHERAVAEGIARAKEQADPLGVGVLVAVVRGVPSRCGPWPDVPAGEVHFRACDALFPDDEPISLVVGP